MNMPRVEGARSKDPNKYFKDALALEKGLIDEPNNSRYYFYLGQSYRDSGKFDKALQCYKKRTTMTGYGEEINVCYHQLGHCSKMLDKKFEEYGHYYLEGYNTFPHRLECFYEYIRETRISGKSKLALKLGEHALLTPYPNNDHLFILKDIYTHLFKTEIAQCCIDQKMYNEAIIIFKYILDNENISIEKKDEITQIIIKICDMSGKEIQDISAVKVTYNTMHLLDSKIEIRNPKFDIAYYGPKDSRIEMLKIPRKTISEYNQNTIYVYIEKKDPKWNETQLCDIIGANNLHYLVENDIPLVKRYLSVMKFDLVNLHRYININKENKDIVLLGIPSLDKINNIIKLMRSSNRLFIFVYDNSLLDSSTNKLLDGKRHLFVSNIQSVNNIETLGKLFSMINISDPSIGWMELHDERLKLYSV
jgi:tetratricopeptide (TPR) repeat protein